MISLQAKAAYTHALEGYSSLNSNDTPPAWLYRLNLAEVAWAEGNLDHALAEARIILAKCEESTAFGHGGFHQLKMPKMPDDLIVVTDSQLCMLPQPRESAP